MALLFVPAVPNAAEATQNSSSPARKSLECLPVELKAQILSNLAVRAIVRARLVSRHFRDLIDGQENQTLLFEPIQLLHQTRLRQLVAGLIHYDPKEDILEAFSRYIAHRGLCPTYYCMTTKVGNFLVHWERVHNGEDWHPAIQPRYNFFVRDFLTGLLEAHMRLHLQIGFSHLSHLQNERGVCILFDLSDGARETVSHYLELTQADLDEMNRKVKHTPGGFFTRAVHEPGASTRKPIVRSEAVHFKMARFLGIPDVSEMEHICDTGVATDVGFHYCVGTDRERERLQWAVDNEEDLSALHKALILEETFLH